MLQFKMSHIWKFTQSLPAVESEQSKHDGLGTGGVTN